MRGLQLTRPRMPISTSSIPRSLHPNGCKIHPPCFYPANNLRACSYSCDISFTLSLRGSVRTAEMRNISGNHPLGDGETVIVKAMCFATVEIDRFLVRPKSSTNCKSPRWRPATAETALMTSGVTAPIPHAADSDSGWQDQAAHPHAHQHLSSPKFRFNSGHLVSDEHSQNELALQTKSLVERAAEQVPTKRNPGVWVFIHDHSYPPKFRVFGITYLSTEPHTNWATITTAQ